jgi:hypothetical protein
MSSQEVNAVFCSIVIVSHTVSCHRFTRILITFVFHCCRIDCFGETCAVYMRARFLRVFCSSVGHSGECEGIAVRSQMLQAAATPVTGRENPLGQEKTVCIPVAKFHRAFIHLLVSILILATCCFSRSHPYWFCQTGEENCVASAALLTQEMNRRDEDKAPVL